MGYRLYPLTAMLVAMAAVMASGCPCPSPAPASPCDNPTDLPPDAAPDQAPPGVDPSSYGAMDNAAQACSVLGYLKCPEATASCADDMRKMVELGSFELGNVLCIRQSRTVTRVRACQVECKR